MSYNNNFYNNFRGNYTFHNFALPSVPPPPPPPPVFLVPPAQWNTDTSDINFLKRFETQSGTIKPNKSKNKSFTITKLRENVCSMLFILTKLIQQQKVLEENMNELADAEWESKMQEIDDNKMKICNLQAELNDSCLETLRKLLAKRTSKRLRLKRVNLERKREKEERVKLREERSRKIDENLQKIKDDIDKAKQEEQSKLEADMVLKETLRKKNDAKKCVVKLDALMKLRRARQNTARGRGEHVSESDATAFNNNIEKLKTLWAQKVSVYEKEEVELRSKLTQGNEEKQMSNETENEVLGNLGAWRKVLFGAEHPQVDFGGDLGRFVAVRCQWDQFVSSEGTALPVAWVPPAKYNIS